MRIIPFVYSFNHSIFSQIQEKVNDAAIIFLHFSLKIYVTPVGRQHHADPQANHLCEVTKKMALLSHILLYDTKIFFRVGFA